MYGRATGCTTITIYALVLEVVSGDVKFIAKLALTVICVQLKKGILSLMIC